MPAFTVDVTERRVAVGDRSLAVGPLPEVEARALAGLLLNRADSPAGPGPWRCAVAGGGRVVALRPIAE